MQRLPLRNLYWPYDGARRSEVRRAVWHGLEAANPLMDQAVDRAAVIESVQLREKWGGKSGHFRQ